MTLQEIYNLMEVKPKIKELCYVYVHGIFLATYNEYIPSFTLKEFAQALYYYSYRDVGTVLPCMNCRGAQSLYNPEDRDIYEGYKLATKYICKFCKGTGSDSPTYFNSRYLANETFLQNYITQYNLEVKKKLKALKKLKKISEENLSIIVNALSEELPIGKTTTDIKRIDL